MSSLVLGPLPKEVLLHSCCAPCSAAILEWLQQNGVRPTI
ncbi:epoxyqueuosine reductase QueH, partial [uncultured Parasutterella sp.]